MNSKIQHMLWKIKYLFQSNAISLSNPITKSLPSLLFGKLTLFKLKMTILAVRGTPGYRLPVSMEMERGQFFYCPPAAVNLNSYPPTPSTISLFEPTSELLKTIAYTTRGLRENCNITACRLENIRWERSGWDVRVVDGRSCQLPFWHLIEICYRRIHQWYIQ